MKLAIESALNNLETLIDDEDPGNQEVLANLFECIEHVQTQYIKIIHQSLSLLIQNKQDASYELLSTEREKLDPARQRIAEMISNERHRNDPFLKLVLEYLFTRARLVEELKMFPTFGIELLERLTIDDSLDETIYYLESAMTGKRNLFENLCTAYEVLKSQS